MYQITVTVMNGTSLVRISSLHRRARGHTELQGFRQQTSALNFFRQNKEFKELRVVELKCFIGNSRACKHHSVNSS